jgi:ribonuclease HI
VPRYGPSVDRSDPETGGNSSPIVVFTDGACLGNPGPGGWAWAVPRGDFASGPDPRTTNQRMEIRAALEAVRALDSPGGVQVVSDSTYVVNCFRDRWWEGWLRRGWVNSARKPVANRDLWEPLVDLVRARGNVTFRWVKGHSGDLMNDFVDELAVYAARTQRGQTGNMASAARRRPG